MVAKIIVVTGIPGSGSKNFCLGYPNGKNRVKVYRTGDMILAMAQAYSGPGIPKENLLNLQPDMLANLRDKAFEKLIDKKLVAKIKADLPEMPEAKLEKLLKKFAVGEKDAKILTRNLELVEFVEKLSEFGIDVKKNISWITIELLRVLNYNKMTLEDEDVEIMPEHLAELIKAVSKNEITVLKGKQIMNDFVPKSFSLKEHKGEIANIDDAAIENLCKQVISENAHVVDEYRGGKDASLNYLIGQVMRLSERRADFKVAGETIKRLVGRE